MRIYVHTDIYCIYEATRVNYRGSEEAIEEKKYVEELVDTHFSTYFVIH